MFLIDSFALRRTSSLRLLNKAWMDKRDAVTSLYLSWYFVSFCCLQWKLDTQAINNEKQGASSVSCLRQIILFVDFLSCLCCPSSIKYGLSLQQMIHGSNFEKRNVESCLMARLSDCFLVLQKKMWLLSQSLISKQRPFIWVICQFQLSDRKWLSISLRTEEWSRWDILKKWYRYDRSREPHSTDAWCYKASGCLQVMIWRNVMLIPS